MKYIKFTTFFSVTLIALLLLSACSSGSNGNTQSDVTNKGEHNPVVEDTTQADNNNTLPEWSEISLVDFNWKEISNLRVVLNWDDDNNAIIGYIEGIMLTGYTGSETRVRIPDELDGKPVVAINDAFKNSIVTAVYIPDSVKVIWTSSFYGSKNLTSARLPEGLLTIDDYAFCETGLTDVIIPDSVTQIGTQAYQRSAITSVVIGNGVRQIAQYTFGNCTNLKSVVIGSGIEHLGNRVFFNCSSLTSVTIPDSVTSIEQGAFDSCKTLDNATKQQIREINPNYNFD